MKYSQIMKIFIAGLLATALLNCASENDEDTATEAGISLSASSQSFTGLSGGDSALIDIDKDSDLDLIITGQDDSGTEKTEIYKNNGSGTFTKVSNPGIVAVTNSDLALADFDGDSDNDLIITGYDGTEVHTYFYKNDGSGGFTKDDESSDGGSAVFVEVQTGSISVADIDGDTHKDVVILGQSDSDRTANIYTNDGSANFSKVGTPVLTKLSYANSAFADIDGDNDQDLVITGYNGVSKGTTVMYKNDGSGSFTDASITLAGTDDDDGDLAFADLDSDNDQDLVMVGYNGFTYFANIYKNDGSGGFTAMTENDIKNNDTAGGKHSSVVLVDIDNDDDIDIINAGKKNDNGDRITAIYLNDGNARFTDSGVSLTGSSYGSLSAGDVDGDGDIDLLLTGETTGTTSTERKTTLYINSLK